MLQKKIEVLSVPSRTTRFQTARYRSTAAGRKYKDPDSSMGQFLLATGCCQDVKDGGHKPGCTGYSIGEMKEVLHSTEKLYLEARLEGQDKFFDLWERTVKQHNEICSNIRKYIVAALMNHVGGPLIELVA